MCVLFNKIIIIVLLNEIIELYCKLFNRKLYKKSLFLYEMTSMQFLNYEYLIFIILFS